MTWPHWWGKNPLDEGEKIVPKDGPSRTYPTPMSWRDRLRNFYRDLQREPSHYQPTKDTEVIEFDKHDVIVGRGAYENVHDLDTRCTALEDLIRSDTKKRVEKLKQHKKDGNTKIVFPEEDRILTFRGGQVINLCEEFKLADRPDLCEKLKKVLDEEQEKAERLMNDTELEGRE